MISISQRGQA